MATAPGSAPTTRARLSCSVTVDASFPTCESTRTPFQDAAVRSAAAAELAARRRPRGHAPASNLLRNHDIVLANPGVAARHRGWSSTAVLLVTAAVPVTAGLRGGDL